MGKVLLSENQKKKKVLKVGKMNYSLPTEPSKPISRLGGYTMLLYGRKKIGKTSLASRFKKALFLMFEPGGKALSIYQESMTSWRKFTRFVELLKDDKEFNTVVIDTGDYAYEDCSEHVCEELGIDHPADLEWGKGWGAVRKEFTKQIRKLLKSGKGVIIISHQREEDHEDRRGRTHKRVTNTLAGQAKEAIEGLVDIWANYDYREDARVLTILGNDEIDAGHRLEQRFFYPDGSRIRRIPMGNNADEAYENFIDAFNNRLEKPEKEEKGGKLKKKLKVESK